MLKGRNEGRCGYVCFYKGKREEVHADTIYEAQQKAGLIFKTKKGWDIAIALAERDGVPVVHTAVN